MKKHFLLILCFCFFLLCLFTACQADITDQPTQNHFTNISFSDLEVIYDGNPHSLFVLGAPDFATVTYEGNSKTEIGSYTVTAKIEAEGYETLTLSATLTVLPTPKQSFTGISLQDKEVAYDGNPHSLFVLGAPDFATVTYEGNGKTEIGSYTVTAKIEAEGYETLTLSATLTVLPAPKQTFTGITLQDKEVTYDGNPHSLFVVGAPDFATVTYEGNGKTEIGSYTVTAKIEAEGYETLTLSATLTILPIPLKTFEGITFPDKEVIYDGKRHSLSIEGTLPEGARVTYKAPTENACIEVGNYRIEAKLECEGYTTKYLYATLTIVDAPIIAKDPDKNEFLIKEDLGYDDFVSALMGGNFIVREELGSRQTYPDGRIVYTPSSHHTYAVTEGVYYAHHDYIEEDEYLYDTLEFAQIVNDQVLITVVRVSDNTVSYYKIPREGFLETFGGIYIAIPFVHLNKAADGGFTPTEVPAYHTLYADYAVTDGEFTIELFNYYYHPEFTNSEVSTYTYSNIGNVKINIPTEYRAHYEDIDSYEAREFTMNGIDYSCYDGEWSACLDLSFYDAFLIKPKDIVIPASIYGVKVKRIYYPYRVYHTNYEGYAFCVYVNENLTYQDKYESLGSLIASDSSTAISHFERYGGVVRYYGSW